MFGFTVMLRGDKEDDSVVNLRRNSESLNAPKPEKPPLTVNS